MAKLLIFNKYLAISAPLEKRFVCAINRNSVPSILGQ